MNLVRLVDRCQMYWATRTVRCPHSYASKHTSKHVYSSRNIVELMTVWGRRSSGPRSCLSQPWWTKRCQSSPPDQQAGTTLPVIRVHGFARVRSCSSSWPGWRAVLAPSAGASRPGLKSHVGAPARHAHTTRLPGHPSARSSPWWPPSGRCRLSSLKPLANLTHESGVCL